MDKVHTRYGKHLQRAIKTDPDLGTMMALNTAFALIGFVTTMTASGRYPGKMFKTQECDSSWLEGLKPQERTLSALKEIYALTDRISVEIETGALPCCAKVSFKFYGKGKGQPPYLRFECVIESEFVRKFPSLDLSF